MKSSNYLRTLEEILDSDDELTTDYIESSFIPAYQDDDRFEYFKDLYQSNEETMSQEDKTENIFKKGIFNKRDAFCFQSIQTIPRNTLLWFFEFLLFKDLHSKYIHLKSCLVPKYEQCYLKEYYKTTNIEDNEAVCIYKIVLN